MFRFCGRCGGVFLAPSFRLDAWGQRKRYELHRNDPSDEGYRSFLLRFIEPVLACLPELPRRVLDFGCGPLTGKTPALVTLLEEQLPEAEIRGWDPFFAPDTSLFAEGADLVMCLEVAEHFESPREGFASLAAACRPGGRAAVGTMTVPEDPEAFDSWWYKDDPTHVSLYSVSALEYAAVSAGLVFERAVSERVFLFFRPR
ncbi:MAG: class I SAM-dependent methyltransferase [Spirochaetaceae bacterium]|nr:class I SAM-dependent methyltransferase [Spirochaetaceae bacterium]